MSLSSSSSERAGTALAGRLGRIAPAETPASAALGSKATRWGPCASLAPRNGTVGVDHQREAQDDAEKHDGGQDYGVFQSVVDRDRLYEDGNDKDVQSEHDRPAKAMSSPFVAAVGSPTKKVRAAPTNERIDPMKRTAIPTISTALTAYSIHSSKSMSIAQSWGESIDGSTISGRDHYVAHTEHVHTVDVAGSQSLVRHLANPLHCLTPELGNLVQIEPWLRSQSASQPDVEFDPR